MGKFIDWFIALNGADYIDFAMLIFTVIGGAFALLQWVKSNRNKRAEFISGLIEKLRGDEEIDKTIYLFDYEQFWYNEKFHDGDNGLEHKVDKTLSFFSYICYLRENRLIEKKDFEFFRYEIKRIADNYSVQSYFYNLYHFSKSRGTEMTFCYLFNYCYNNGLFGDNTEIKNPDSKKYPKYLNF